MYVVETVAVCGRQESRYIEDIKRALLNLLSGYHIKAQAYNIRTRDRCSH